ncbi:MAG TPA: two-component regulator propeller domain-containing protein, partial [Nitrospira sp.]|nr:two-component regulator propeller domain-containing protein [Nitrospira sp.]
MRSLLLEIAVFASLIAPLKALNPSRNLDQYYHETWTSQRGLPGEAVYQILQSSDGYLWLRTSAGLVRFDGVQFVMMDDALGHEPVKAIAAAADGHILIRTTSRTILYQNGRFSDYRAAKPLPDGEIRGVFESSNHEVLVGSDDFLYSVASNGIHALQSNTSWINVFLEDSRQTVWIGGEKNLYTFHDGALSIAADARKVEGVFGLAEDHEHTMWAGTPHGLFRLRQGPAAFEPVGTGILRQGIRRIFEDHQHNLWLGTTSEGLVRVSGGSVTSFNASEGLSDNGVYALFEDREGSLWVGTANGLDRFRDTKLTTLTTNEGLPSNDASTAIAARDGSVYVLCSYGGLARIKDGKVVSVITRIPGLPSIHGGALFEDKDGRLWLGARGALTRIDNGKITVYNADPRLSKEYISSINEDDEGLILGTSATALFRFKDGKTYPFLVRGKKTALTDPGNYIFAIYRQPGGTIWFGTVKGLFRYDPGQLPKRQPGIDFPVTTISDDQAGNLWLGGRTPGITRLRIIDGQVVHYLKNAGLFNAYAFRVLSDNLGNLWMGTTDGIFEAEAKDL